MNHSSTEANKRRGEGEGAGCRVLEGGGGGGRKKLKGLPAVWGPYFNHHSAVPTRITFLDQRIKTATGNVTFLTERGRAGCVLQLLNPSLTR